MTRSAVATLQVVYSGHHASLPTTTQHQATCPQSWAVLFLVPEQLISVSEADSQRQVSLSGIWKAFVRAIDPGLKFGTAAMCIQIVFSLFCAHTPLIAHLQGWQLQPACHDMQGLGLRAADRSSSPILGKRVGMTQPIVSLTVSETWKCVLVVL